MPLRKDKGSSRFPGLRPRKARRDPGPVLIDQGQDLPAPAATPPPEPRGLRRRGLIPDPPTERGRTPDLMPRPGPLEHEEPFPPAQPFQPPASAFDPSPAADEGGPYLEDIDPIPAPPPPPIVEMFPPDLDPEFVFTPATTKRSATGTTYVEERRPAGGVLADLRSSRIGRGMLLGLLIIPVLLAIILLLNLRGDDEEPAVTIAPQVTTTPLATPVATPAATAPASVVSEPCANAFLFAESRRGEPEGTSSLERTTGLCGSVDEWLAGARLHPGALGLSNSSEVDQEDIRELCGESNANDPVCRDAQQRGVLATPAPGATATAAATATPTATQQPPGGGNT